MKQSTRPRGLEGDYLGYWDRLGISQIDFLKSEGLQPSHTLLDVACGSFRGGRFFIDYLERGRYFGIDRDAGKMERGIDRVLKAAGLDAKSPRTFVLELGPESSDLAAVLGFAAFDYVWIHSLFDHIPPPTIVTCLRDTARVTTAGGRIYATFFLNPHGPAWHEPILHARDGKMDSPVTTYPDREHWHQTLDFFEDAACSIPGLRLDACLDHYPHPLGLKMLRFIRS